MSWTCPGDGVAAPSKCREASRTCPGKRRVRGAWAHEVEERVLRAACARASQHAHARERGQWAREGEVPLGACGQRRVVSRARSSGGGSVLRLGSAVLGPRGRVVPAAAPHALDHLMRYNLDRREMQSKEGSRRISANECIAPRNRPHKTGSPRSLCRPTSAAVRAVVARAGSRSPRRLLEGSRKPPRRVAARAGRRLSPPGCDCARRRVPPAPGVARVDCHAVARLKQKAVRLGKTGVERRCRPPRRRLRWRRREGPSCLARPTRQRRPPARRDSVKRRCSQPASHARARPPAGAAAAR